MKTPQDYIDELYVEASLIIESMSNMSGNEYLKSKFGIHLLEEFEKAKLVESINYDGKTITYKIRRNSYNAYLNILLYDHFILRLNNLSNMLYENLENIFEMDKRIIFLKKIMEILLQKHSPSRIGPIHQELFYDNRNITFIDGFIMEGKTTLLSKLGVFDSELEMLYRANIKGTKVSIGESYYNIFILVGSYLAIVQQRHLKNPLVYLDSSFIRHGCFRRLRNNKFDEEYKANEFVDFFERVQDEKLRSFFENIFLFNKSMEITINYQKINRIDYSIVPFPIPVDNRQMETAFYKNTENLVKRSICFHKLMEQIYENIAKEALNKSFPFRRLINF